MNRCIVSVLAFPVVAMGLALAPAASQGQPSDPCTRCKPAQAEWSWKANGYAVAGSADDALGAAKQAAIDSACRQSAPYLEPQKLRCRFGCSTGETSSSCAPSKEPACQKGTYSDNRSKWMFVCRKYHQEDRLPCDEAEAQTNPGYGMCDVSVKAIKSLACSHPDCNPDGGID